MSGFFISIQHLSLSIDSYYFQYLKHDDDLYLNWSLFLKISKEDSLRKFSSFHNSFF